jgi:DNA-binding PadR family transcriptional regulator
MLSLGDKSGYDLKKEFEQRVGHFWAESLGQIYPTLHRLRKQKWVESRSESIVGRPGRTVYRLTPAGLEALRDWIVQPPMREPVRNELLLKLFFGPQGGIDSALVQLREFERREVEEKAVFDAMQEVIDRELVSEEQRVFWRLTLLSGLQVKTARIKWARQAQRMLREHRDTSVGKSTRRQRGAPR